MRTSWPLGVAFAFIVGGRALGLALAPVLLVTQPIALLLLSPLLLHLVLLAGLLDPRLYVALALPICLAQCAIGYELGVRGSARFKRWVEVRLTGGELAAAMLRWLHRSAPVALFLVPGPIMCAAAGITGVAARLFYATMIVAQVFWVAACLAFGVAVTEQIATLRDFVMQHVVPLTGVTMSLAIARHLYRRWCTIC